MCQMRVIAGKVRRMSLIAPEGNDVRPTTDRIKETLFNILQNYIAGASFFMVVHLLFYYLRGYEAYR